MTQLKIRFIELSMVDEVLGTKPIVVNVAHIVSFEPVYAMATGEVCGTYVTVVGREEGFTVTDLFSEVWDRVEAL